MNDQKTIVVFRTFKENNDVIALFPELNYESGDANRGMCMSYQHVGQHSEADYDGVIRASVPAKEWEYEDLELELRSLGYSLDIRHKKPAHL